MESWCASLFYRHWAPPLQRKHPERDWENITNGTFGVTAHISGQLENLIHQMLTVTPESRPFIEGLH